jgi:thiol-disulfide isomerase/thioredoxin
MDTQTDVGPFQETTLTRAGAIAIRLRLGVLRRQAAALMLAVAPLAACAQGALQAWAGPAAAPPIELRTLDGRPLVLAALRGKVVVVNFWATWCEPCVDEMPSMQRLYERLAGEPFEIFAVNFQESEPRIRAFLGKVPVTFSILRDTDGSVVREWKVRIFPSSFVVDAEGALRYVLVGAIDWSNPEVEKTLRSLLQPSRPGTPRR